MSQRPGFFPSPYSTNQDLLKTADTCPRKLCLVLLGAQSDIKRQKAGSKTAPVIPLGQPHTSALGLIGEEEVAFQAVGGQAVDIHDDFDSPHLSSRTDWGRYEESPIPRRPEPPLAKALERSWPRMSRSIAGRIDREFSEYAEDPFIGFSVEPHKSLEGVSADLSGYTFNTLFRQFNLKSSALLLRGFVDLLAQTEDGELMPIEVMNSARFAVGDVFQLGV